MRIMQIRGKGSRSRSILNRDAGSIRSYDTCESRGGSAGCTRQTEGTEETVFIGHAGTKVEEQVGPRNKCVEVIRGRYCILIVFLRALKHGCEGDARVDSIVSKTLVIP